MLQFLLFFSQSYSDYHLDSLEPLSTTSLALIAESLGLKMKWEPLSKTTLKPWEVVRDQRKQSRGSHFLPATLILPPQCHMHGR